LRTLLADDRDVTRGAVSDTGEQHPIEELALRLDALGCTPEEVARVEADYGQPLPHSFRIFLETMGRDVGGLFGGSDIGFPDMLGMRQDVENLLVENECRHALPDDALVFMMHQGYILYFVRSDDPQVFGWSEGLDDDTKHQFQVITESLDEFLLDELNSTGLPPHRKESHRRSTQTIRRLRFQPESCPHCSTPFRQWLMDLAWGPGELNPGRDRMVGTCEQCGRTYWRWSDSPDASLKRLRGSGDRPTTSWWRKR
jgi:hypothetical protein